MQLSLNVGVILAVGNQILDQYDLIPLVLYALDDTGQRVRGIFRAVVHEDDGAVGHLFQHVPRELVGRGVLLGQAVDARHKSKNNFS